jgi:hypothetical protein
MSITMHSTPISVAVDHVSYREERGKRVMTAMVHTSSRLRSVGPAVSNQGRLAGDQGWASRIVVSWLAGRGISSFHRCTYLRPALGPSWSGCVSAGPRYIFGLHGGLS